MDVNDIETRKSNKGASLPEQNTDVSINHADNVYENEQNSSSGSLNNKNVGIQNNSEIIIDIESSPILNLSYFYQDNFRLISDIKFRSREKEYENITIRVYAETDIFDAFELKSDFLEHGATVSIANHVKQLVLKVERFAELSESIDTSINVEILDSDGQVIAKKSRALEVTAFNQWTGDYDLLASFVTPNSTGVSSIISRAEDKLEQLIKKNSGYFGSRNFGRGFLGYQTSDPQYVALEAEALYLAVQDLGISYRLPPASFWGSQRIRLFDMVLNEKTGTCLDTTCFYASLLEAVGLHAVIFVLDEHALIGVMLNEESGFNDPVIDDRNEVYHAIELDNLLPVETTDLTDSKILFKESVNSGKNKFASAGFECCVDIKSCRARMIKPLPTMSRNQDGSLVITDDPRFVKNMSVGAGSVEVKRRTLDLKTNVVLTREQQWENKLLDLSTRNRLLNMKTSNGSVLRVFFAKPEKLEDELRKHDSKFFKIVGTQFKKEEIDQNFNSETMEITGVIESKVLADVEGKGILNVYNETKRSLEQVLKKIAGEAKASYDENGANSLFLSLYSVLWYDDTAGRKQHEAPLMLLPVDIKKDTRTDVYSIKVRDEELIINYSLIELMRQYYGINLNALNELPEDEYGVDVLLIKDTVLNALPPGWKILKTVCLGNFSFRKFVMWQDLSRNNEFLQSTSPVYKALAAGKFGEIAKFGDEEVPKTIDSRIKFGDVCQPIQADSSQLDAVVAAETGKSFVLQGPPGTGKSQTITNIIASALERGKKVLFVAAKMAALEVVQERLSKLGLSPFCLELHSNTLTKSKFLERINIDVPDTVGDVKNSYDIIKSRINQERDELNGEVEALHEPVAAGMSVYGAICRLVHNGIEPEITIPADDISKINVEMIMEADSALRELKILTKGRKLTDYTFFESRLLAVPANPLNIDSARLRRLHDEVYACVNSITELLGFGGEIMDVERLTGILSGLEQALNNENMDFSLLSLPNWEWFVKTADEGISDAIAVRDGMDKLGPNADDVFKLDLREELKLWKLDDEKFFIFRYFAHSKSVGRLQRALGVDVKVSSDNYIEIVESALKIQELRTRLADTEKSLAKSSESFATLVSKTPEKAREVLDILIILVSTLKDDLDPGQEMKVNEAISRNSGDQKFRDRVKQLAAYRSTVEDFCAQSDVIRKYFNIDATLLPHDLRSIADRTSVWVENQKDLNEWIEVNKRLNRVRNMGFSVLVNALFGNRIPTDAGEGYASSVFAKSVIEWQFSSNASLSGFNPELFEDKIKKFNEDASEFRKLSGQLLINHLTTRKNHLKNAADAALQEEISFFERAKKSRGRGLSIRNIFNKMPNLMPRIAPCMLMSPISVAQYLSPDKYSFDLIIFDEASQLPTSEAVGAIGRGKQVIVVGDPKQMPPTEFFEARQSEETENADLESVLDDCMTLGMPTKTLSWHYRSRHESLISFSNTMYYEGNLYTFPSPDDMNSKVTFNYVNGIYDRGGKGTNADESREVVAFVKKFLENPVNKDTSIGIVTFNSKQQSQIEDDLAEMFKQNPELEVTANECKEPLFVKNLENVQGDERDVIVFSVGFGKDRDGRISMNFGPLNRDGGERRLNVAVTRAKKEMVVFSSLEPEDGRITSTTSRGVIGLFDFLKYARNGSASLVRQLSSRCNEVDFLVQDLADRLKEKGFNTKAGVGTSAFKVDLAVRDPRNSNRYLACIMADGIVFKKTPSAIDRFYGQPGVLKGLGWNVLRFWTPDWWKNKEAVLERLVNDLKRLEEELYKESEVK